MLFYRPTKKSNHTFSLIRLRLPAIISLIPLKNKNVKLIPILPLLMLVLLNGCAAEWQKQRTADGQLQLAGERDEYVPVLYSQTQSKLGSPLGYDLLAQPLRRATLERADQALYAAKAGGRNRVVPAPCLR